MKHHLYSIDSTLKNEQLINEVRHYNTKNQTQSLVILFNPHKQGIYDVFIYSYLSNEPLLIHRSHSTQGLLTYLFKCPFRNLPLFTINALQYVK